MAPIPSIAAAVVSAIAVGRATRNVIVLVTVSELLLVLDYVVAVKWTRKATATGPALVLPAIGIRLGLQLKHWADFDGVEVLVLEAEKKRSTTPPPNWPRRWHTPRCAWPRDGWRAWARTGC